MEKFYNKLISVLGDSKYFTVKQLYKLFDANSNFDKQIITTQLSKLVKAGKVYFDEQQGKYSISSLTLRSGRIDIAVKGFGFFIDDDKTIDKDIFVPRDNLNGAMQNDKVLVKVGFDRSKRKEAQVVQIVEHSVKQVIGAFNSRHSVVVCDDIKMGEVTIPRGRGLEVANGSKVLVDITQYATARSKAVGEIVRLVDESEVAALVLGIATNGGLSVGFTQEVLQAAAKVPTEVTDTQLQGRADFRSLTTFTIDGADAKDFDDAVSIEKDDNGYTLGVHIADVSYYVKQNGVIDKQAYDRATSVYFPQLVIPMLPFELSNEICSLKPNVDRLTMSVIIKLNNNADVVDYKIYNAVINSKARLTYDTVSEYLLNGQEIVDIVKQPLKTMQELADKLIGKRQERGVIDFDSDEMKFVFSDTGELIDLQPLNRTISHKMIEEFMIMANEVTARFVTDSHVSCLYRVHESPDATKLQDFVTLVRSLGLKIKNADIVTSKDLRDVVSNTVDTPYYSIVSKVLLRTMQKAKYSVSNIGHYGLNSQCYCHFTSPIRRYPDLVVHRAIKMILDGTAASREQMWNEFTVNAATQSTAKEINADMVERDVDDLYKTIFAKRLIGEEFDATISGVAEFGIFAQIKIGIEGLIKTEFLPGDRYLFDATKHTLKSGQHSYSLGDKLKVVIVRADEIARQIDMQLVVEKAVKK